MDEMGYRVELINALESITKTLKKMQGELKEIKELQKQKAV